MRLSTNDVKIRVNKFSQIAKLPTVNSVEARERRIHVDCMNPKREIGACQYFRDYR